MLNELLAVSTHSHPKVAAKTHLLSNLKSRFQHTATRRWLRAKIIFRWDHDSVSTHSHPKVAASMAIDITGGDVVSTHSHPKVAAIAFTLLV